MKSTSQEVTLVGKSAFERWAATLGVKNNRYHEKNWRFSEQPFRSAIEDSNQTITFCGVGSYHPNEKFERRIQTLTLGVRTLLLYATIYWPEEITTMLWPYSLKAFAEQLN